MVQNLSVPFDIRVWLEALALRDDGWAVSVICPRDQGEARFERLEDVDIYRYAAPPEAHGTISYMYEFAYGWTRTFLLSLRVLFRSGFDVIHACNPPDTLFLIGRFYRLFGKRFVYDQHDLCPELFRSRFAGGNPALHQALLWLERQTFSAADVVLSSNPSYREIALSRGQVDESSSYTVMSCPDLTGLDSVVPDESLRGDARYLACCIGVLNPQDGVDCLIEAARVVVKERGRSDVRFAVIGGGDDLEHLQRLTADYDLSDNVVFTGWVDRDRLMQYVAAADICVSPDPKNPLNDLSTSKSVMEYMALGRPVVAFDLRETRRMAGKAALYATPNEPEELADCIARLLDDADLRQEMSQIGKSRIAEGLSWEHSRQHLLEAYSSLALT